jgi:putative ABC transport system permease protein
MDTLLQDLRYAVRRLLQSPAFTVVAVLTLALGIGATTAVFSVVNSLLLHPLPFPDAERIVYVWQTSPDAAMSTTPPEDLAENWRLRSHSFEAMEPFTAKRVLLGGEAEPAYLDANLVSPTFLSFLGERPALGRSFAPEEAAAGGPQVALLGHGTWIERFGSDREVLGRTISLDGRPFTIIGVMPRSLTRLGMSNAEVWLPLRPDLQGDEGVALLNLLGRLRPGVTTAQAEKELNAIRAGLTETAPFFRGWRAKLLRPQDFIAGSLRTTLLVLFGAVGLVLLIACANVAGLLLTRAAGRGRELAVRTALGASRGALVRQLLVESLVLAVVGGALGALLALWGVEAVTRFRPDTLGDLGRVGVDSRALLFTGGATVLSALLFGLWPALRASQAGPLEALKSGTPGSIGPSRRTRLRSVLVATEVALSVVLLVGAGLLLRTLVRLGQVDPGFRAEGLVTARIALPEAARRDPAGFDDFARALEERVRSLPGVVGAVVTGSIPLHYGISTGRAEVQGRAVPDGAGEALHARAHVPPGYLALLGVPLVHGRDFAPSERSGKGGVLILGEGLARQLVPDGNAVGLRIRFSREGSWSTVVGVARDVAATGLRGGSEVRPQLYVPLSGESAVREEMWLVARTSGDAAALLPLLRDAVRSLDREMPVPEVSTGEELLGAQLKEPRFYTLLLGGFAALALVLAAIGLFGVLSYAVRQRTREIGVRVALGARASAVLSLVVRQGMTSALAGLGVGLVLSLAATRVMRSLLYEIQPGDPGTLLGVALLVTVVALVASYLPARRATRVDPMIALRHE